VKTIRTLTIYLQKI